MLEFYEVNELEKKWEDYNKNRKQFSFLKSKPNFVLRFDKTILGLLILISVAIEAIFWLLKDSDSVSMASINQNIEDKGGATNSANDAEQQAADLAVQNNISKEDYNISAPKVARASKHEKERPSLNLNDVGVLSSEDSGGFKITNNYENGGNYGGQAQAQNFGGQNFGGQNFGNQNVPTFNVPNTNNAAFANQPPKNEVIDFGRAPLPPKSNFSGGSTNTASSAPLSSRIEIKTSNLSEDKQSLESKFYATNKIEYSLSLAEEAYNKKDYDNAIKWALTSNELDKDNVASWIIFAKANYKKGRKEDALYALETFNAKAKNSEISNLISKIRSDKL